MKLNKIMQSVAVALALTIGSGTVLAQKPKKAEVEYPDTKRSEPKSDLAERDQKNLNKAQDLIGEDNAQAEKILTDLLAKTKSKTARAYGHQMLSSVYTETDQDDQSIAELRKSLEVNALPNNAHFGTLYRLAQIQVQAEKYEDALVTLDQWEREGGKTTSDSLALRGNVAYRLDRYQDAVDAVKKAIAANGGNANESWNQILMASYFELNQFDQAADVAKAQLDKNPGDIKLVKNLATVYIQGDNYPAALAVLAKAKNDGLVTTGDDYVQLAKLYANAEKPKEAAAVLKEGLDKGIVTGDYENYKLLGDASAQAEDDEGAIAAYAKASPFAKDGYVDYQRAYILFYADRAKEAKVAIDAAIQKGGLRQEGEAYLIRGDVNNELNQDAAALVDWKKAATFPSSKSMAEQRIKAAQGGVNIKRAAPKGKN